MSVAFISRVLVVALLLQFLQSCRRDVDEYEVIFPQGSRLPGSLMSEHARLLLWADSILPDDSTGIDLKLLLRHHFREEEKLVFPLLGTLPVLADGKLPDDHEQLLSLGERMSREFGHMSAEHQMVQALFGELKLKNIQGLESLEQSLSLHARLEEEVLFPAALVAAGKLREIAQEQ